MHFSYFALVGLIAPAIAVPLTARSRIECKDGQCIAIDTVAHPEGIALPKRLVVSGPGLISPSGLCIGSCCDGLFNLPVEKEKRTLGLPLSPIDPETRAQLECDTFGKRLVPFVRPTGDEHSFCDVIGGCDGNLATPQKRKIPVPFGKGDSWCDGIGGCDGNLATPEKRTPLLVDVKDLPHISVGNVIGIGPEIEKEKRSPSDIPARSADPENASSRRSVIDYLCGFKGCGVAGLWPETQGQKRGQEKREEENRDPQYELCVMPFGCRGDSRGLSDRLRGVGLVGR